jgi:5-methylcytosine-specific restriction endonuclease McrA
MSTRTAVIQVEPDLAEAFNSAPKTKQKRALSAMRSVLRESKPAKPTVARAKGFCEYCHTPEGFVPGSFAIEHIIPRSKDGKTILTQPRPFLSRLQ